MKVFVLAVSASALQGASAFALGASQAGQSTLAGARATSPALNLNTSPFGTIGSPGAGAPPETPWGIQEVSPDGRFTQRVEGQSRRTWKFNDISKDRVQVALVSEGRPVHSDVQLWLGPDWTPMKMSTYTEDGLLRPIQTLVGTRNKPAMIEVRNVAEYEFPFKAAANYAKGEMAALPLEFPQETPGVRVDGGALHSFPLDTMTEQLEVVLKTEGRQLNAKIELINGPNNVKQTYEIFTNNGELNSLCVAFNTPDAGNTVRIVNLAPVEFPCYIHLREI